MGREPLSFPGPSAAVRRFPRTNLLLVIDDDKTCRFLMRQVLEDAGFEVVEASDGAAGLRLAKTLSFDVVLVDYHMPGMTGHEVLSAFKKNPKLRSVPVLVVTSDDGPDVISRALELGAADFVLKPFEPVELLARIRLAQRIKADRDELQHRNEELERVGSLDQLTGIPNRAHLDKELVRLASQARRRRSRFAVLAIDVDLFKQINDHHGHATGDTTLRAVAEAVRDSVRAKDVFGRLSGDEFLVLLPDTDGDGAGELAERIRSRVGEALVDGPDGQFPVTVTIGAASGTIVDPRELVRAADAALYSAKESGRNRVSVATGRVRDKQGATTVLIVDDHRMVAEGMARLIEHEEDLLVAGVVTTVAGALDATRLAAPDVVLLDYNLPDNDGITAARLLREIAPDLRIVLVTGEGSDEVLLGAIDAGCCGYLDKGRASVDLVASVRLAHAGEIVMAPRELRRLVHRLPTSDDDSRQIYLTDSEREILALAAEGLDNDAMADRLGANPDRVRRDVKGLLARLDAASKLQAVATASRRGLIGSHPSN